MTALPAFDMTGRVNQMLGGMAGPRPVKDTPLADKIRENVAKQLECKARVQAAAERCANATDSSVRMEWTRAFQLNLRELNDLSIALDELLKELDR